MEALTSGQQSDLETMRQNLEAQHKKYTEDLKLDLQQAIQVWDIAEGGFGLL